MKFIISIITFIACITMGQAQTAFTIVNLGGQDLQRALTASSVKNPWLGAKITYNIDEDKPLNESFVVSGKILVNTIVSSRLAVPVVTSIGLGESDIFNPDAGFNIGLAPYYELSPGSPLQLIAHGYLGYKVIEEGVNEFSEAPQQFKISAGFEAILSGVDGGPPTTLSVAPSWYFNNILDDTGGIEITGVLPIGNRLALLAEGIVPFDKDMMSSSIRFGVIAAGALF